MNPRRVVGVDVGGTSIKLGAVELGAEPVVVTEGYQTDHAKAGATELAGWIRDMADQAGWDRPDAVGLGLPGLVDQELGGLRACPNLQHWIDLPLREAVADELGCPVRVDNDATAFAVAEWRWGAGKGCTDAVFLTLGTGIGGGIVCGGRLQRGAHGFAGEPGHMVMAPGLACPCGNDGCAERVVGRDAVVARARSDSGFTEDPLAMVHPLTPQALTRAADAGSELALAVWRETGTRLGDLLVSLTNLLDPQRFVIGGGLAKAGDRLLEPARDAVRERALAGRICPPEIVPARFGGNAGLLGAAGLWFEDGADPVKHNS